MHHRGQLDHGKITLDRGETTPPWWFLPSRWKPEEELFFNTLLSHFSDMDPRQLFSSSEESYDPNDEDSDSEDEQLLGFEEEQAPMALNPLFVSPTRPTALGNLVTPHHNPPTPQQRALAAANGGILPLDQVFTLDVNPKTGNTYLADATACMDLIRDVVSTFIVNEAKDSTIISSNLYAYESCVQVGVVTKALIGAAYGYDISFRTENATINARCATLTDENDQLGIQFFNEHFQPLIDYAFNYVIPQNCYVKFSSVQKCNLNSFITSVKKKRKGRCNSPIWSNGGLRSRMPLASTDSAICNGHLLEYVLIMDRCVEGFVDCITCNTYYVTATENVPTMLANNRQRRLYA